MRISQKNRCVFVALACGSGTSAFRSEAVSVSANSGSGSERQRLPSGRTAGGAVSSNGGALNGAARRKRFRAVCRGGGAAHGECGAAASGR